MTFRNTAWNVENTHKQYLKTSTVNNIEGGSFTTDYTPQFGRDRFKGGHLPEDLVVFNPYDSTTFHMSEQRKDKLGPND